MARILVVSLPFAGHVGPTAAVAAELVRRGHDVTGYTGAKYRGRFESVGARWLQWRAAKDYDDARLADTFPRVGDGKGIRANLANFTDILLGTAPGQLADIAAAGPFDLIVTDQLAFGGGLAGEKLGVPWATVAVIPLTLPSRDLPPLGLPVRPATGRLTRWRNTALWQPIKLAGRLTVDPRVARMRAAAGLGPAAVPGPDGLYSPHLVLAQGVPGLDYPRGDQPAHVHYVGRLAAPAGPPGDLPSWWPELAAARAAGRPVVHVTQGTLDVDPDDLLRPTLEALAGSPALVVCTTGGPPADVLGTLPANARAAAFLPHDHLLPLVDVVVSNAGWGGTLAAVAAGVPMVVAGATLDKPEVARRVAWSGTGVDLRTGTPGAARLRSAVTQVLGDPRMRERAAELGAKLAAAGGVTRAADLLEGLRR
ncbi:nucleotide disphospho-sugar-binding domain-containing protein [Dactylosporangium sp. NPDC005555]|uniref:glycosyltransferase n=1 Tax=Dactylosporangium sp. NPDC005555 TaxID=3154889 RepID=UPI0033B0CE02